MDRFNPDAENVPQQTQNKVPYDASAKPDFELGDVRPGEEEALIAKGRKYDTVPAPLIERTMAEREIQANADILAGSLAAKTVEKSERKKLGLGAKIGAVAATVAVGVGGYFGVQAVNAGNNTLPEKNPNETSQEGEEPGTNTGEEKPPVDTEKTLEERINETKIEAGLSAKEYSAELFEELLPTWKQLGANQEYWDAWSSADEAGRTTLETDIAEENADVFTNALFIPGWDTNPNLVNVTANLEQQNIDGLQTWRESYDWDGSLETEEWKDGNVITSVNVISEDAEKGTRTLEVSGYQTNNATETATPDHPNAVSNGAPWSFTITTTVVNDTEYISDWVN